MRLPGTCSRYSNRANPQLSNAAMYQGRSARFFRCAYQANVMNTFEQMRSRVAVRVADRNGLMKGTSSARDTHGAQLRGRAPVVPVHDTAPATLARGGNVLGTIVDEDRVRRCQRKAPLGLRVDAGVGFHDAGEIGRQRPVTDAVQ